MASSNIWSCFPANAFSSFFFFNDTATTEIYTLSLHDALPISCEGEGFVSVELLFLPSVYAPCPTDRKSTRLNSSHLVISYAVFCLKKKQGKRTEVASLCNRYFPLAPALGGAAWGVVAVGLRRT